MKFDNMINELFIRFPELKNVYEEEGDYIKDLQHPTYGIVFVPYIRQMCLEDNKGKIQDICNFMECMANSDDEDEHISELLVVSVLELVVDEREIIHSLKRYLGINTQKLLTVLERDWGFYE